MKNILLVLGLLAGACENAPETQELRVPALPLNEAVGGNTSLEWWGPPPSAALQTMRDFEAQNASTVATMVRVSFQWARSQAPYTNDIAWLDRSVDLFRANGIEILGVLIGTPAAAALYPDAISFSAPASAADFARFAAAMATHFRGRVKAWEIWNEPNVLFFWGAKPESNRYAALAVAATEAIHHADPFARVVIGATAPTPTMNGFSMDDLEFIDQALRAETKLGELADVFSLHAYSGYPPRGQPEDRSNGLHFSERVGRFRAALDARGLAAKPVWVTEFGFCTGGALTEDLQAAYLIRSTSLLLSAGAQRVFPWVLLDHGPGFHAFADLGIFDCEKTFGLFHNPPAPKPAARAFAALRKIFGEFRVAQDMSARFPPNMHAVRLVKAEANGAILWSVGGEHQSIVLTAPQIGGEPTDLLTSYGMEGRPLQSGASLTLDVGPEPVYVLDSAR